jgi:hypothetical protein
MTCSKCKTRPVWKFTNQTQLCKKCFEDYFERKVWKTIRTHGLLPKNKIFLIKKSEDLNTKVLINVIKEKFNIDFSNKPNINNNNLSSESEIIFSNLLKGNFKKSKLSSSPLSQLSDEEIELYAKLKNIHGKKRIKNTQVQQLFSKFKSKNPDLEHNVVRAFNQI